MESMEEDRDRSWDFVRDFDCESGKERFLVARLKNICENSKYMESPELAPPPDCITKLVTIFHDCNLSKVCRELILKALVPWGRFSEDNVDPLMVWLLSHHRLADTSVDTLIYWLAMMVEYKKLEAAPIIKYYSSLVRLLLLPRRITSTCKLLIAVTQPKYVSTYTVHLVSKVYKSHPTESALAALLSCYKTFSPELMGMKLPSHFNWPKAQMKSSIESMLRVTKLKELSVYNTTMYSTQLLPTQNFGYSKMMGSLPVAHYIKENPAQVKFTDINGWEILGKCMNKMAIPCNTLSLLGSRVGFMVLFLRRDIEERFIRDLEWGLKRGDEEHLLKRVIALEEYLKMSLEPASEYLASRLPTWDGLYCRSVILELIPWAHFDTFEELQTNYLVPLGRVFMVSEIELKVKILNSVTSLITNMVCAHMEKQKWKETVTRESRIWKNGGKWIMTGGLETVRQTIMVLENFIKWGLLLEMEQSRTNPIFLNQVLIFYHSMSILEVKSGLLMWTMVPWCLVATCLIVRNMSIISLLCSLLTRYKKVVIPHLISLGVIDNFEQQQDYLNKICRDLINFLWKGQVLKEGHVWDILSNASPSELAHVRKKMDLDEVYCVKRHSGISPMVQRLATKMGKDPQSLTDEEWLLILDSFMEDIAEFIREYS